MLQKCPGRPSQVGNCAVGHILYIRVAKTDFSPVILKAPGRQPLALSVAAICRIVIFPVPDCVRAPVPGLGRLRRAGSPPIQGDKIGKQFGIALGCLFPSLGSCRQNQHCTILFCSVQPSAVCRKKLPDGKNQRHRHWEQTGKCSLPGARNGTGRTDNTGSSPRPVQIVPCCIPPCKFQRISRTRTGNHRCCGRTASGTARHRWLCGCPEHGGTALQGTAHTWIRHCR